MKELDLPPHYNPKNVGDYNYKADPNKLFPLAEEWKKKNSLKSASGDKMKIALLEIDAQVDFSFPEGSLYVAGRSGTGAIDANRNLVEFGYRNLNQISEITCTMDSHLPFQVFFPSAHLLQNGAHPTIHTIISGDDYDKAMYSANPAMAAQLGLGEVWLTKQWQYYCHELEKNGKYKLYLWPYHCLVGSNGNRLIGAVEELRLFHAWARGSKNNPETKGGNPLTEHYSVFSPEVTTTWDNQNIPGAQKNVKLMNTLLNFDRVYVGGLASSHCVKESIADFLKYIVSQDKELAKKVYILQDCTAAVVVPGGYDFTDDATKAIQAFKDAGMNVAKSTDPIE